MTLKDGGKFEALLRQRRYENGLQINVESNINVIDIDNCQHITVVIIIAALLVFFVLTTLCLLILVCRLGNYCAHIQDHGKKKDTPQLKDIESNCLKILESVDTKDLNECAVNTKDMNTRAADGVKM